MTFTVTAGGRVHEVRVTRVHEGLDVEVDGRRLHADLTRSGAGHALLLSAVAGESGGGVRSFRSFDVAVEHEVSPDALVVHVGSHRIPVQLSGRRRFGSLAGSHHRTADGDGAQVITAPMPGRVVKVLVRDGEVVEERQGLVVVEAMKMENELRAPRAGRVTGLRVAAGSSVDTGAVLLVVE